MADYAFENATLAMQGGAPSFCGSIGLAVGNDGERCAERGARWLIGFLRAFAADIIGKRPEQISPWTGFDLFVCDIEALERIWPVVEKEPCNGHLARFLIERCPALWRQEVITGQRKPVSKSLHMADQLDTLISFFNAGITPTGSKDPFALRRAANYLLRQILFPIGGQA